MEGYDEIDEIFSSQTFVNEEASPTDFPEPEMDFQPETDFQPDDEGESFDPDVRYEEIHESVSEPVVESQLNASYSGEKAHSNDDIFMMPEPEEEEDALTVFNKQWMAKLEEKRALEYEFEKTARSEAVKEYETWNTQRDIRMQAKKESNRGEEEVVLEAIESEVEMLSTWDRVGKHIDAAIDAKELSKGSDTSRMHKLFIQLKNEPLETTRGE
jgi:hypothetical protein